MTLPVASTSDIDCPVIIMPATANRHWRAASRKASDQMSRIGAHERDCKEILVEVTATGAVVTLTTTDGRHASRPVAAPDEIVPVISALIVGVPADSSSETDVTASQPETKSAVAPALSSNERNSDGSDALVPSSESPVWYGVVGGAGGARIINAAWGISPMAALSLGVIYKRLEVGLMLSREFGFSQSQCAVTEPDNVRNCRLSATSLELFGGLRQPVGNFAIAAGPRITMAFVGEPLTNFNGTNVPESGFPSSRSATQLWLGGYAAIEWPVKSHLRLRLQVGFAGVVKSWLGKAPTEVPEWPALPSLGANSLLGLQWSVL